MSSNTIQLTPDVLASFKTSKLFRTHIEPLKQYTSTSFDDRGEFLITAAQDDALQVFSCRTGKHHKQLYSKKYGAHIARFTHRSSTALYASTKENDDIRYVSFHDNSFLRYFKGHTKAVNSLEMSPVDDTFISSAKDDTVRLWDLRSPNCQGYIEIAGQPCVAFDPTGLVFAVVLHQKATVLLYDMRSFDKAPFLSEPINDPVLNRISHPPRIPTYTSIKFSNDGKHLLLGTSGRTHYVLDSFTCNIKARLEGQEGLERSGLPSGAFLTEPQAGISGEETCWTPDSRYVLSGSDSGHVHCWDVNPPQSAPSYYLRPTPGPECTLQPILSLKSEGQGPTRCVNFNPRAGLMVSAGLDLSMWLPKESPNALDTLSASNSASTSMDTT